LNLTEIKNLFELGSLESCTVVRFFDYYSVQFNTTTLNRQINLDTSRDKELRKFKTLESVANVVGSIGFSEFRAIIK